MKNFCRILLLPVLTILAMSFARHAATQTTERVVAVVNKDIITQGDVLARAEPLLKVTVEAKSAEERNAQLREIFSAALRSLIDEKLLNAEGQRLIARNAAFETHVEDRLKDYIEDERRRAGGEVELREKIRSKGLTYAEYLQRVRTEMLQQAVLYTFVERDLSASPEEVRDDYVKNAGTFQEPEMVKYRQIFLRAATPETRTKARQTAAHLMELIGKQHDFAKLATEYSDGPRAADGGLWDFSKRGLRPKPVDDLIFSLKSGETGGPVETEIGLTIVKVEERKPARTVPFEEVQSTIERKILADKRRERYAELMQQLEARNYVKVLPGESAADNAHD